MSENIKDIPVDLINEPDNPMRSDVWDEKLNELAMSIKEHGLIQPITIVTRDNRYEVIAGHRRLAAFRKLGFPTIPAVVREMDQQHADIVKIEENLVRADVNPVDQAEFLARYIRDNNVEIDEAAARLHRSADWVKGRLEVADYPEYIKEDLRSGALSLGAAAWLARIPNEKIREEYSHAAAVQGLSATRARYWYDQGVMLSRQDIQPVNVEAPTKEQEQIHQPHYPCLLCKSDDVMRNLQSVLVHPDCFSEYNNELDRALVEQQNNHTQDE